MAMAGIPDSYEKHHTSYAALEEAGLAKTIKLIESGDFSLAINVVDRFYTCCAQGNPFYFNLFKKIKYKKKDEFQYLLTNGISGIDEIIEHVSKSNRITEEAKKEILSELKKTPIDFSNYKKYLGAET